MSLQVDIRIMWHGEKMDHQLCQVSPEEFTRIRKKGKGIYAFPVYFANFGTKLKPVIKVWPEHESEIGQKTSA